VYSKTYVCKTHVYKIKHDQTELDGLLGHNDIIVGVWLKRVFWNTFWARTGWSKTFDIHWRQWGGGYSPGGDTVVLVRRKICTLRWCEVTLCDAELSSRLRTNSDFSSANGNENSGNWNRHVHCVNPTASRTNLFTFPPSVGICEGGGGSTPLPKMSDPNGYP